jgi:hypothetical protein
VEREPSLDDRPGLVLDEFDEKLNAFNALRKSDAVAADRILDQVGASGAVDRQIVLELAAKRPLGHPDRFPEAHRGVVRALEVLDRNAANGIEVRAFGPLGVVVRYLVQQVVHFLVKSHVRNLINQLGNLYTRREAAAGSGDPSRRLLTRARIDLDRVAPGFRGNPLGFPTFILGGAFLSTILGSVQGLALSAVGSTVGAVVVILFLFAVLIGAAWVVLRGAAIARRRIRLTTDAPMNALYQTIGRCGSPPGDQARTFALIALLLMGLAWVVVPIAIGTSLLVG